MNKKVLKMIFAIIFFFSINIKVNAAEYDLCPNGYDCWVGYQCLQNTTGWSTNDLIYYTKTINEARSLKGLCPTLITKTKGSTTTYEHVYCLEPGVSLKDTRKAFKITDSNKVVLNEYLNEAKEYSKIKGLTPEQKTRITQILTFALRLEDPQVNKARKSLGQVVGAQGLIWEVVTKEREKFNSYVPDQKVKSSFYDMITNKTNQSKSQYLVHAESDYKRIIDKIKGTFDSVLGESGTDKIFKTAGAANVVPMTWDGSKFVLEITDVDFQHWSFKDSLPEGVTAKKVNNKIVIESKNPIPEEAAVSIKMEITRESWKVNADGSDAYAGEPTVLFAKSNQDVITVIGTNQERIIKVYTPQYGIEITKTATVEGAKNNLKGAEFKLYDTNGTTVLSSGTTDENGELTFVVNKPGTYKIEETKSPAGYKQKTGNEKYSYVTVTSQNKIDTGKYATVEIENESRKVKLIKYTVDENGRKTKLNDECTEEGAAAFSIKNNGKELYFKPINGIQGKYILSNESDTDADNKVLTCNGEFVVYNLTECDYTIIETKAPAGMTIPAELKKDVNVCNNIGEITFTNGFAGVEFLKKDEDGILISGGSFALQKKENGMYRDVLLKKNSDGVYEYDANLTIESDGVDYIFHTLNGNTLIRKIAPGDYRIVEKEAPEGYEPIEDKDSTAIFTVKPGEQESHYLVELINQRVNTSGSDATAELVVTITTGRSRINYLIVMPSLIVLLVLIVIIRKKLKK